MQIVEWTDQYIGGQWAEGQEFDEQLWLEGMHTAPI